MGCFSNDNILRVTTEYYVKCDVTQVTQQQCGSGQHINNSNQAASPANRSYIHIYHSSRRWQVHNQWPKPSTQSYIHLSKSYLDNRRRGSTVIKFHSYKQVRGYRLHGSTINSYAIDVLTLSMMMMESCFEKTRFRPNREYFRIKAGLNIWA